MKYALSLVMVAVLAVSPEVQARGGDPVGKGGGQSVGRSVQGGRPVSVRPSGPAVRPGVARPVGSAGPNRAHSGRHWEHHDEDHHHHHGNVTVAVGTYRPWGFYGYPGWGWGWGAPAYYYDDYYYPRYYAPSVYRGRVVAERSFNVTAAVQDRLAQEGFYRGRIDGQYGPMTRAAIEGYQRSRRLTVTGQIDDRLLRSLRIR